MGKTGMNNFLLIMGAHQDNPAKLSHILNLLGYLKSEGVDVCFSTHSAYGLSEISELSKYVCYDENNLFITPNDVINSLDLIDLEKFDDRWVEWYQIDNNGPVYLKSFISGAPHQRSALKIVKNGVDVAAANGYKWVGYLEYDFSIPKISFSSIVDSIIDRIQSSKKRSYLLWNGGAVNFMYGGFFISDVGLLANNRDFNSDWFSSKQNWISSFGNKFFETTIEGFLKGKGGEEALIEDKDEFFIHNWGTLDKGLNMFTFSDSNYNREIEELGLLNHFILSFYASKTSNGYNLGVWAYNRHTSWDFEIPHLSIKDSSGISNLENVVLGPGSWYNIKNIDLSRINEDTYFELKYSFRNSQGSGTYTAHQKVNAGDLEKLFRTRMVEIPE